MNTTQLRELLTKQFETMTEGQDVLFEVDVNKDDLWDVYLDSFPEGTNEIYKERREFDCNACKQFVKRVGNIVVLKDGLKHTIWDIQTNDSTYQPVVEALSKFVKEASIGDVFSVEPRFSQAGMPQTRQLNEDNSVTTWEHLHIKLPKKFINYTSSSDATVKNNYRSAKYVFKRSLEELTEESVLTVLELIAQQSLYKGEEWKSVLQQFLLLKKEYDKLITEEEKDIFAWSQSVNNGGAVTRIRNHSMGTLLTDISEDVDLDIAVKKYENIVAPHNYKRPKEIYTKKMLEDAQKTVNELGFQDSLQRRFATLEDISINDILFSNKDAASRIPDGGDVFAQLAANIPLNPKQFSKTEEVSIDTFLKDILPKSQSIEAFVENKHKQNFVSLIAPVNKDSKTMFKWDNNFSWAYSGNITDSDMKANVKNAGGNVDGVLRFSIQWNDVEKDKNDLDAHCIEPGGNEIYYGNKRSYNTTGELDVDIINPTSKSAVENITWTDIKSMRVGTYKFFVHNFSHRGGTSGFRAEIEFNGQVFSFDYNKEVKRGANIIVAEVTLDKNGKFTIKEMLPSTTSSTENWGVNTQQFVPVSVVALSPNYWEEGNGTGNKHFMFMLKDCANPESPSGFFNEFLIEELNSHKRVFAALGSKLRVQDTDNQLSGLGFSSTQRNELLVKVTGVTERVVKVKF